ncbi:MAG: TIGR02099 family protein [Burkholderiaceae bacterium]|nr:TIGR02099 family protein [Burkholderiaceae bacterium]
MIVLAAGYSFTRYYLWPKLDRWRPEIESALSAELGQPLHIGSLAPGFDGIHPRLRINDLRVGVTGEGRTLSIGRVDATLSWRSALLGQPRLVALRIADADVAVVRLDERRWELAGLRIDLDGGNGTLARWLLEQPSIRIESIRIAYDDRVTQHWASLALQELSLQALGRRHRFAARAEAEGIGALELKGNILRQPETPAPQDADWSGDIALDVARLDWAALRPFLSGVLVAGQGLERLESMRGDAQAKVTIERGRPVGARLRVALSDLRLAEAADGSGLELAQVGAELNARWDRQRALALDIERGSITVGAAAPGVPGVVPGADRVATLALAGNDNQLRLDAAGEPLALRLNLAPFEAGEVLALLPSLGSVGASVPAWLTRFHGSGRIEGLELNWERGGEQPAYSLALAFRNLALGRELAHEVPWPSFAGMSGELNLGPGGGAVNIEGERAGGSFPGVFEDPLIKFDKIAARVTWTVQPPAQGGGASALKVEIASLRFANADAAGELNGSYRSGGKGPGLVDLTGTIERAEARSVARYLPLQVSHQVRDWLGRSLLTGRASAGHFRLRGDLADFPYRDVTSGEFRVDAQVGDATLAYSPGWPAIERFDGHLEFERAGMLIAMKSGAVFGAHLGATTATIPDFRDAILRVEGSADGSAQDMVRFVNESPLRNRIDDFTTATLVDGRATLSLRLTIPLRDNKTARVNGSVLLAGNNVQLEPTLPRFDNVHGRLDFTEEQLALRTLSARLLGGEIKVEGETTGPGRFALRASGKIGADGIRRLVDNQVTRRFKGAADYRATIDVNRHAARVHLESDLVGLASTLPAPFTKAAEESWALRLDAVPETPVRPDERPVRERIDLRLRDDVHLAIVRQRDPVTNKLAIRSASFALNAAAAPLPSEGLKVALGIDEIDLDAWNSLLRGPGVLPAREVAGVPAASEFAAGFPLLPDEVSVVARRVHIANKDIDDVVFGATRLGGYWNANVHARQIDGFFSWLAAPSDRQAGSLTARFARLEIGPDRVSEIESLLAAEPETLPALDVVADEFVLGQAAMGRLELRATNRQTAGGSAWQLDRLSIRHPGALVRASGTWALPLAPLRATDLDFEIELSDAGLALDTHGIQGALRGGVGMLTGKVNWVGSPLAINYPSLSGELQLAIGKGQFLKTDPGIGKLIGVLSLQSLARRLTLDFRDIFAKGFAFDEITGDVAIRKGVASTDELKMKGVQAQVKIRGTVDIANETQRLQVEIRPELNAGLASLAYATINPVLGLGSLVAQAMLNRPLQEMFSSEYRIDGSWSSPNVVEVKPAASVTPVR